MGHKDTKKSVVTSLVWKLLEGAGTQGTQFIVTIVLARILLPKDFGVVALITVFIAIAAIFVNCSFNLALIQKKNTDDSDFSSAFCLNIVSAIIIYSVLFCISPLISDFYKEPLLTPLIRVSSITLFFGAVNSIQNAFLSRNMMFKKLFFSSFCSILLSGTFGILLAIWGFGAWALVGQQLLNQLSITLILWFTVRWRPKSNFSFSRVKVLFSYGWKMLASSLIDTLYNNLRNLLVGKMYKPEILGYFNRGQQLPYIIVLNIDGAIQSVMLPVLSVHQDDPQTIKKMMRRSIVTSSFIVFPLMIGLAAVAKPLIEVLLTDKWLPCVPFLQIQCMVFALYPVHTANLQAISALGRSDIFLKLETLKKIVGFSILIITVFFGVYAIALGGIAYGIIATFINAYPNSKLLQYSYLEQCKDIMPSLALSAIMGSIVFCIQLIHLPVWLILITQVMVGIALYIALAWTFKLECFDYILNTFFGILKLPKLKGIKEAH